MNVRDVPGYPGWKVSDEGSVYETRGNLLVRVTTSKTGPYASCWYKKSLGDNTVRGCYVHRLVALAFAANPHNLPVVRHIDGNPENNISTNLAWGSPADNTRDMIDHGRMPVGVQRAGAKLTDKKVREIRFRTASGEMKSEIAASMNVSNALISAVNRLRVWKHVK